jgi:hypothetical protein
VEQKRPIELLGRDSAIEAHGVGAGSAKNTRILDGSTNGLLHLPARTTNVDRPARTMAVRTHVARSACTP